MENRNNLRNSIASLLLLLLVVAFPNYARAADSDSKHDGNFLLKLCSAVIKISDKTENPGDQIDGIYCAGYLEGFTAGHNSTVFDNRRRNRKSNVDFVFCTIKRTGVTSEQIARVVLKFLQENPQALDQPMEVLTMAALSRAFPCNY